jgi:hypothetical protein
MATVPAFASHVGRKPRGAPGRSPGTSAGLGSLPADWCRRWTGVSLASSYSGCMRMLAIAALVVCCCSCGSARVPRDRAISVANPFAAAIVHRDCAAVHRLVDAKAQLALACPGTDTLRSINAYVAAGSRSRVWRCPRKIFHVDATCVEVEIVGHPAKGVFESGGLIVAVAHHDGRDVVTADGGYTGLCTLDCRSDARNWARRVR